MRIQVPWSWLKDYVEIDRPVEEVANLLHMSGTEVDHIERVGTWEKVWVGRISALERHPNAERLTLATVDYGGGRRRTVVTGASNLSVGAIVPYAEAGARLRSGEGEGHFTLVPKKVRGVESEGMVCSARELELGEDHEGILILDPSLPVGAPLAGVLGETVLHLEVQPNRPDCLGVLGIAREVAALTLAELREPPVEAITYGRLPAEILSVRIEDPSACPRFAAAYLEGVRSGPSPAHIRGRLVAAGMRPIDSVVDVTNYVMLELGQPLHAYDAQRLRGRALVARWARPGEHLRTLDGIDRVLPATTLVIADEERALGVAGILGGEDSEIQQSTSAVALECASFEPRGIGRTAAALGLQGSSGSAAARRFAWELSPELVPVALARAVRLLREHAGARLVGAVDVHPRPRARPNVRMRFSDVARVLGADIARDESLDALRRLGFRYADDGDTLVVTPPAIRTDVAIAEDVVEEVARIVGYDRIPTRVPDGPLPLHEPHPLEELRERARDSLVGLGLQETVSYSLIDPSWLTLLTADGAPIAPEPLRVRNPTTVTQSIVRTTLRASLFDTARRNLRHRDGVAIFEIAPVYLPRRGDLPDERWTIGILLAGRAEGEHWLGRPREYDVYDLAAVIAGLDSALRVRRPREREPGAPGLRPGRAERYLEDDEPVLTWGQVDPRVAERWELPAACFVAEVDLRSLVRHAQPAEAVAPPRYPAALRDVAYVVPEAVPYGDLEREIQGAGKETIESATLLDVYRGPQAGSGKKSFAVRLVLRSPAGTLSDTDVDRVLRRVEGRLRHALGATVRA